MNDENIPPVAEAAFEKVKVTVHKSSGDPEIHTVPKGTTFSMMLGILKKSINEIVYDGKQLNVEDLAKEILEDINVLVLSSEVKGA